MADSIWAGKGVKQALQIVPNGKAGRYFVVDGNMRLAGARLLGKDCPKLKCEILDASAAEQLLTMLVTAKFRYDPDPISEALHYKRLMDEEGYKIAEVSKATGIAQTSIYQRLKLLGLDKDIQALIGSRLLPSDKRAAEAFLSIPDAKARVKLAERMAQLGSGIKAIVAACAKLKEQLELASKPAPPGVPSVALALRRAFGKKMDAKQTVKAAALRRSAAEVCEKCSLLARSIKAHEPAWSLITHSAEETCKACDVRAVKSACGSCPAVDLLRRVVLAAGEQRKGRDYE
jgi:ParB/RepB/Spo0J family partition protein